ncbi:vacuolar protein sorting-associated protein, putative [Entamoeba invadens IP1]|uniref:Vacuolar protein sorting-associated protein, putative n=1 Tax=Entamoeba invadens IP1 TaxID=370355 RepID=A0A0A1U0L1_ENTIV|nr:vacuolar protein sorting-associated protein, putative [Entamoeba invadens IP1]ELP87402.1 vacuolar protein sorting-associated protein, putative [Entamoeba invadens IP1]|eukprot:XP_004254173.1 vacuolar protein sorting-associated protein, putative [Entamoeba invadens IP1]
MKNIVKIIIINYYCLPYNFLICDYKTIKPEKLINTKSLLFSKKEQLKLHTVFEGVVSQVLTAVLGNFIEGLSADQLKLGIIGGVIELHNLEIKKSALDFLNLPVSVSRGVLGNLTVLIPWSDLLNKPIQVLLSDIAGLVEPQKVFVYDENKAKEDLANKKKVTLTEYEIQKAFEETKNAGDGIVTQLIGKIIENIKISIENVHFQFLRPNTEKSALTIGVCIESIDVSTIKNPSIPNTPVFKMKAIKINHFSVYICPNLLIQNYSEYNTKQFLTYMRSLIPSPYSDKGYKNNLLISPTTIELVAAINISKGFNINFSKVVGQVNISDILVTIDKSQYVGVISLLDMFFEYGMSTKYLKYRPQNVPVKTNPKLWWKYIYNVKLDEIKEKNKPKWNGNDNEEYMALYKKTLGYSFLPTLTKKEVTLMDEFESKMETEEILHNRERARREIEAFLIENPQLRKKKSFVEKVKEFCLGFFVKQESLDMKTLTAIGDFKVDPEALHGEPADYKKMKFGVCLNKIQLVLTNENKVIYNSTISDVTAKMILRPQGFILTAEISDMMITENSVEKAWNYIIRKITNEPLVTAQVDMKPLDNKVDLRIGAEVQQIDITLFKQFVINMALFFQIPNTASLEKAKQFTADKFQDVWNTVQEKMGTQGLKTKEEPKRNVTEINATVLAPKIAVLLDETKEETESILVNLGSVKVSTATESDYDIFNINVTDVSIATQIVNANYILPKAADNFIVDPISFETIFGMGVKKQSNLPQMKLSVLFEKIGVEFSVKRYDFLVQFLPKWGSGWEKLSSDHRNIEKVEDKEMNEYLKVLEKSKEEDFKKMKSQIEQIAVMKIEVGIKVIELSLKKKEDEMNDIIRMEISNIQLGIFQKTFEMKVEALVQKIKIFDCICKNENFFIATTNYYDEETFFEAFVEMIQKESPNFKNCEMFVLANIRDFHLALRPETLGELALFAMSLVPPKQSAKSSTSGEILKSPNENDEQLRNSTEEITQVLQNYKNGKKLHEKAKNLLEKLKREDPPELLKKMKIEVNMRKIGLVILNETNEVLKLEVQEIKASIAMYEWGMSVRSSVQRLLVVNMVTQDENNKNVLDTVNNEQLLCAKIKINNLTKQLSVGAIVTQITTNVDMNLIKELLKTVKNEKFMKSIRHSQDYISEGIEDDNQMTTNECVKPRGIICLSDKSEFELLPSTMKITCEIAGPKIKLPINMDAVDFLQINMGNLKIANRSQKSDPIVFDKVIYTPIVETMKVSVDSIQVETSIDTNKTYIVKDIVINAQMETFKWPECFTEEMKENGFLKLKVNIDNIETYICPLQIQKLLEFSNFAQDSLTGDITEVEEMSSNKNMKDVEKKVTLKSDISTEKKYTTNTKQTDGTIEWPPVAKRKPKLIVDAAIRNVCLTLNKTNGVVENDKLMALNLIGLKSQIDMTYDEFIQVGLVVHSLEINDVRTIENKTIALRKCVGCFGTEDLLTTQVMLCLPLKYYSVDQCTIEQPTLCVLPDFIGDVLFIVNEITNLLPKTPVKSDATQMDKTCNTIDNKVAVSDDIIFNTNNILRKVVFDDRMSTKMTKQSSGFLNFLKVGKKDSSETDKLEDLTMLELLRLTYTQTQSSEVTKQINFEGKLKTLTLKSVDSESLIRTIVTKYAVPESTAVDFLSTAYKYNILVRSNKADDDQFERNKTYLFNPVIAEYFSVLNNQKVPVETQVIMDQNVSQRVQNVFANVNINQATLIVVSNEFDLKGEYILARTSLQASVKMAQENMYLSSFLKIHNTDVHRGILENLVNRNIKKELICDSLEITALAKVWQENEKMSIMANLNGTKDLKVFLSFNDINTINTVLDHIVKGLDKNKPVENQPKQEEQQVDNKNESLKPLDDVKTDLKDDKNFAEPEPKNETVISANLSFNPIEVYLVNDLNGRTLPLLKVEVKNTEAEFYMENMVITTKFGTNVCVKFFNDYQMQFEPFISDFGVRGEVEVYQIGISQNVIGSVKVDKITVNICHATILSALNTVASLNNKTKSDKSEVYLTYLNETGEKILIENNDEFASLENDKELPLVFDFEHECQGISTGRNLITKAFQKVVKIDNQSISVDAIVSKNPKLFLIENKTTQTKFNPLISEVVTSEDGRKKLYLHSDVMIENKTDFALEFVVKNTQNSTSFISEKQTTKSLPLCLSRGEIFLKTQNKDGDFTSIGLIEKFFTVQSTTKFYLGKEKETKRVVVSIHSKKVFDDPRSQMIVIKITPTFTLLNSTPYDMTINVSGGTTILNSLNTANFYVSKSEVVNFSISTYQNLEIDKTSEVIGTIELKSAQRAVEVKDSKGRRGFVYADYFTSFSHTEIVLYAAFYVMNYSTHSLFFATPGTMSNKELPGQNEKGLPPKGIPFLILGQEENPADTKLMFHTEFSDFGKSGDALPTSEVGFKKVVDCPRRIPNNIDCIRYEVAMNGRNYTRTRQIKIYDNYIAANSTKFDIKICAGGVENFVKCKPENYNEKDFEKMCCKSLLVGGDDRNFQIGINGEKSIEFPMNEVGEYPLAMKCGKFDVSVKEFKHLTYICLYERSESSPPYRIINNSKLDVTASQDGQNTEIKAQQKIGFYLPNPRKEPVIKLKIGTKEEKIDFNKIDKRYKSIEGIGIKVIVLEGTRTLLIDQDVRSNDERSTKQTNVRMNLLVEGVEVNLSNEWPDDLLSVTLENIEADVSIAGKQLKAILNVDDFQIDNMALDTPYPVLLCKHKEEKSEKKQVLHVTLIKRDVGDIQTLQFEYFTALLQQLDIMVDGTALFGILNYVSSLPFNKVLPEKKGDYNPYLPEIPPKTPPVYLFFKDFQLQPMKFVLTFKLGSASLELLPYNAMTALIHTFGSMLGNLDHSPISINNFFVANCYEKVDRFVSMIVNHVTMQVVKDLYLLLGSADFLGNPVGLVSNVGSGVKAFFYEPIQGLTVSPGEFACGVGRGSKKLLTSTGSGVLNSASKIGNTLATGVAGLTMDEEYIQERQRKMNKKDKGLVGGLTSGLSSFGNGLVGGVKGVFVDPLKGAKDGGISGFGKGIGKGVVGLVTKPITGAVDLVSSTAAGAAESINGDEKEKRKRDPRIYCNEKGMRNYTCDIQKDKLVSGDTPEDCIKQICKNSKEGIEETDEIDDGDILVLTNQRIFVLDTQHLHFKDGVDLSEIKTVSSGMDGIDVILKSGEIMKIKYNKPIKAATLQNRIKKHIPTADASVSTPKEEAKPKESPRENSKSRDFLKMFGKTSSAKSDEKKKEEEQHKLTESKSAQAFGTKQKTPRSNESDKLKVEITASQSSESLAASCATSHETNKSSSSDSESSNNSATLVTFEENSTEGIKSEKIEKKHHGLMSKLKEKNEKRKSQKVEEKKVKEEAKKEKKEDAQSEDKEKKKRFGLF